MIIKYDGISDLADLESYDADTEELSECAEQEYYNRFAGYHYLESIAAKEEQGCYKSPVVLTVEGVDESFINDDYWQTTLLGNIQLTEDYAEDLGLDVPEMRYDIYLKDWGQLSDEVGMEGKEILIEEEYAVYSGPDYDTRFSKSTIYRDNSDGKLLFAGLVNMGGLFFEPLPIDLEKLLPEFDIDQKVEGDYEQCLYHVEETHYDYYEKRYTPDIIVKCKETSEEINIVEGEESSLCGYRFFLSNNTAVAKGDDDDKSVGLSGLSSKYTIYLVSQSLFPGE